MQGLDPIKISKISDIFNKVFVDLNFIKDGGSYMENVLALLYSSKVILKATEKIGIIDKVKSEKIEKEMNDAAEKTLDDNRMSKLLKLLESVQLEEKNDTNK